MEEDEESPDNVAFTTLAEKTLPQKAKPKCLAYCPTMDLVAFVTQEEHLHVVRLNGQRVFGGSYKNQKLFVSRIQWKANGISILSLTYHTKHITFGQWTFLTSSRTASGDRLQRQHASLTGCQQRQDRSPAGHEDRSRSYVDLYWMGNQFHRSRYSLSAVSQVGRQARSRGPPSSSAASTEAVERACRSATGACFA